MCEVPRVTACDRWLVAAPFLMVMALSLFGLLVDRVSVWRSH